MFGIFELAMYMNVLFMCCFYRIVLLLYVNVAVMSVLTRDKFLNTKIETTKNYLI